MMHFIIEGEPPTVTAQMHRLKIVRGKPVIYKTPEILMAERQFMTGLTGNQPPEPLKGPIMLKTIWTWTKTGKHKPGQYKTTKPDTDNHIKIFKDCMTVAGFWKDDSQVAYEITVKKWGVTGSIEVMVAELEE